MASMEVFISMNDKEGFKKLEQLQDRYFLMYFGGWTVIVVVIILYIEIIIK